MRKTIIVFIPFAIGLIIGYLLCYTSVEKCPELNSPPEINISIQDKDSILPTKGNEETWQERDNKNAQRIIDKMKHR